MPSVGPAHPGTQIRRSPRNLKKVGSRAVAFTLATLATVPLEACVETTPPVVTVERTELLSPEAVERIDEILLEFTAKDPGAPLHAGLSILHKRHGVLLERYYGGMDPDRPLAVASLSKAIVPPILLRLERAGQLDLNAPIDKYGFASPNNTAPVTPAQLISNLSGLRCPRNRSEDRTWICQFDPEAELGNCAHKLWNWHQQDQLFSPPDTSFCYGGGQWQIAGAVAQVASGRSWQQLFEETYRPCGLKHSGFSNQFNQTQPKFGDWSSYPANYDPQKPTRNPNIEGGMYTTVADYSKLLLMFLNDGQCAAGRVLEPPEVARILEDRLMQKANAEIGPGFAAADLEAYGRGYGLGWWIDRSSGQRSVPGAYGSIAWISPDRSYAAVIALKAHGGLGRSIFRKLGPELDKIIKTVPR